MKTRPTIRAVAQEMARIKTKLEVIPPVPLTLEESFAWAHQKVCLRADPGSREAHGFGHGSVLISRTLVVVVCPADDTACYVEGLTRSAASGPLVSHGFLPGSRLVTGNEIVQICTPKRFENECALAAIINTCRPLGH